MLPPTIPSPVCFPQLLCQNAILPSVMSKVLQTSTKSRRTSLHFKYNWRNWHGTCYGRHLYAAILRIGEMRCLRKTPKDIKRRQQSRLTPLPSGKWQRRICWGASGLQVSFFPLHDEIYNSSSTLCFCLLQNKKGQGAALHCGKLSGNLWKLSKVLQIQLVNFSNLCSFNLKILLCKPTLSLFTLLMSN